MKISALYKYLKNKKFNKNKGRTVRKKVNFPKK